MAVEEDSAVAEPDREVGEIGCQREGRDLRGDLSWETGMSTS